MKYLEIFTIYIGKISLTLSLIMFLIFAYATDFTPYKGWGTMGNLFISSIILLVYRYLSGCFKSSSLKGMAWSVGLSLISSILLIYLGFHHADRSASVSIWIYLIPTIVATIYGIWTYNWFENVVTDDYCSDITADGIFESVLDNGLKNTFNGFMGDMEAIGFASAGYGVWAYSNISFVISLSIMMIAW